MEIFINILLILSFLSLMIIAFIKAEKTIEKISSPQKQRLLRALLYAVVFTPTIYHHAPNTIILPFHLSTISGNLFYGYDYTVSMFASGVLAPVTFGFLIIWTILSIKDHKKSQPVYKAT